MAKHNENDFVIPALKAVFYRGGKATMSEIKDDIGEGTFVELTGEDLQMFESRSRLNEPRYRQVVGNIVSHHNERFFKYVIRIFEPRGKQKVAYFKLTDLGIEYVKNIINTEGLALETETNGPLDDLQIASKCAVGKTNQRLMDLADSKGLNKRLPTDSHMHDVVLDLCGRECVFAKLTGTKHSTFIGSNGKNYVIAHHLIPMKAQKDFFPKSLDIPSNIVCLCPTCHGRIHHASTEEKRKMIRLIYDNIIDQLDEEGLYIGFDKLCSYY